MKKSVYTIIMSLLVCCLPAIQASPLTPAQKKDVISRINSTASSLENMTCSFVQTKHLSLLSDKMTSKGSMHYSQPGKLRWEYTSPYSYLFIFNGSKVYVGNKSKKDIIDTETNKVFKEVARIMMNTVTGKALSDTSDFTVEVDDAKSFWEITLVPKKKEMRQMFSKIKMFFNKKDLMIAELNIIEKNNDNTSIIFSNTVTNKTINANLFAIP